MATKKSAVKDLTNGSPVKLILGFALPLLLGMLFQQFYSMVDTIIDMILWLQMATLLPVSLELRLPTLQVASLDPKSVV